MDDKFSLPELVRPLLKQILTELAQGRTVTVLATDSEMTTQDAADYLKVSRGYLVQVIDRGEIPSRMVGNQRRLKVSDVQLYEKKMGRIIETPLAMRDMSRDLRWLSENREKYAGKWVAIYEGRLIASGGSPDEVCAAAGNSSRPTPLITFIEALPRSRVNRR
ncbi:MAG TPA: excisionase family DNA-binding protein [Blastocatellia bacterium]|nr:excisionase family DNA-binding protein [Blastocatellia bacterium]